MVYILKENDKYQEKWFDSIADGISHWLFCMESAKNAVYQIVEQQDDGETLAIQCFCPADPLLQFRDFVPFENQWCIIYEGIFKTNEKEVIIISEKSLKY